MTITTHCRSYGREFDADRAAHLAGPARWRLCRPRRDPTPPGALAGGAPDVPPRRTTIAAPEAA